MRKKVWTPEMLERLVKIYPTQPAALTAKELGMSVSSVKSRARRLGVSIRVLFSEQEIAYIKKHFSNSPSKMIAKALGKNLSSVHNIAHRLGIRKSEAYLKTPEAGRIQKGERIGSATQFRKGVAPVNKGKKQHEFMSVEAIERTKSTRFKKGSIPHNAKQKDGEISIRKSKGRPYQYVRIKLGVWRELHRVLWEKANGPIPKGYNVQFRDGNTMNCVLENLYLIDRKKQLLQHNTIQRFPPELKKTIRTLSKLKRKIKHYEKQD